MSILFSRIQEGNYAPEEKYGVTERRRIRSSTDSDTVSPTRGRNLSFLEQDNDTPSNVIRPLSSLNNGDVTEASSSCNEVTNENGEILYSALLRHNRRL